MFTANGITMAAATPESQLRKIARLHGINLNNFSIYVHKISDPQPLLAWHADAPRNPASTIKLLTTFIALDELGPDFKWKTESYISGELAGGTTDNLFIKGYGDPYLVTENFWRFIRGIRNKGLQHIKNDLVLDKSYFKKITHDPADFDGRPARSYNVNPTALLLNFQSVKYQFRPDVHNKKIRIVPEPDIGVKITNKVRLSGGRCRGWKSKIKLNAGENETEFSGRYARSCGEQGYYRVATEASPFIHGVFNKLWQEQGGVFEGKWREATVPEEARLLHTIYSPPMIDVIRAINKYSNNVMTRQLLLTLGAEISGVPGTTEKGRAVIEDWLATNKFNFPELVIDNGAGLSRDTKISARHMGQLLKFAYGSPRMPEFISSLPIASYDGTLQKRFVGTALEGRLHLKTGLLDDVRALAGYLTDQNSRRWIIVMMHNDSMANRRAGQRFQDALLHWVFQQSQQEQQSELIY
jgi:D-alanyl-D-alanine carboxypeptidase/D-alanyl-D-alanine-endopeptidase (penicillin-binding protein 4)